MSLLGEDPFAWSARLAAPILSYLIIAEFSKKAVESQYLWAK
jgi:hypothetical protein